MKKIFAAAAIAALAIGAPAVAKKAQKAAANRGEMILHQQTDYNGDWYTIDSDRTSVPVMDWNIRSISIHEGEKWQICAKPRFRDCIELSQSLTDASQVGITGQIGSVRQISGK